MKKDIGIEKWVAGPITRWVTLLVWIVAVGLLSTLLPSINKEVVNNVPPLGDFKPSMQAGVLAANEFSNADDIPALIVWQRQGGLTDADLQKIQALMKTLTTNPVQYQTFVPPLHQTSLQALKTKLSEDGSAMVTPLLFNKQADGVQLEESMTKVKEEAAVLFGLDPFYVAIDSPNNLHARVTGPVGIQVDAVGLFGKADKPLLIGTVLLVLVLLLLIYRSPILALIPLVAVGFAYLVISPILGWMAHEGWITVESQGKNIMSVLLFGAGTDYCLFLISRFRQLLKIESDKGKALREALSGSSGAIAMSGFTVVLALIALLAAEYGPYQRFAAPFSIAILIMGLASLTLVPAMLAILGRAAFWPFVPRTTAMQVDRAKLKGRSAPILSVSSRNRVGSLVVRRPWLIMITAIIILGGLALFTTQIQFTYDRLSSFPKDMASREGFAVIGEQFSSGELAPVKVMVDTYGKELDVGNTIASLPYVKHVSEPQTGKSNSEILAYDVQLNMNPYSTEAMDLIPEIRQVAEKALLQIGVSDAADHVWISGQTAEQYDTKVTGERDMRIIFPIIIGLISLLLFAYLRSLIATVYLILTVILSYLSALGLGWLVIHYIFGADAIQGGILLYTFVFIVALGEDYNIFMISSIWQKIKHMSLKHAIQEGVRETGVVITSAGLILAGTFAVLATMPVQLLMQVGVIVAIGVLLDTFIVRPFLVPAITLLLGKWAFWPGRP
ncbi:hypothetical protein BVG16_08190 [Paenibacillus selenitireducens]|uniref:SSD domain-containing protein n=1 Tax=Paenibacillus selenitireducens TaxID=1324314 RepID=A0A1T2XGY6_9BACL|nr:MMPL family transporter [Paenibacillus selenitireducens]OPA79072.1 hypothetical protein BVG16_08190 [Paenibacillus selenitireducens]